VRKKREERNTKSTKLILILLLIACFMPAIDSGARFVYRAIHDHYVSTKDFYFKSDKLNEEHSEFQVTNNWSGSDTYRIIVNMSSKKNDMAYTSSDVAYNISLTCSEKITCTLSKNAGIIRGAGNESSNNVIGNQVGNQVGNQIGNVIISEAVNEDYFIVYVNPAPGQTIGSGETVWVDITATSTSPYSKSIYGKMIIETGSSQISYEIVDAVDSPFLTLNITNSGVQARNITLTYDPTDILIDMTHPFVINASSEVTQTINGGAYINSITSSVQANNNLSIKFYKEDKKQNYTYMGTGTSAITVTY